MPNRDGSASALIRAFTGIQVGRLTGISQRQLAYWEKSGVYSASFIDETPHRPYRRIYSFRDLVSLKTLALLRNTYGVKLADLREVGEYLSKYSDSPWSELQFKIGPHNEVIFHDPVTKKWMTNKPIGQFVLSLLVDDVRKEAEESSAKLLGRNPKDIGNVSRHRHIAHNKWVVAGTRIPTSAIWNFHQAGYDSDLIRKQYPGLTVADIDKAIAHESTLREAA